MTQYNNTPQVKLNPQDSNLNRPAANMEDKHNLPLNHDKSDSGARNKTSSPQVGGGAGDSIQERGVLGGEESVVLNNKVMIHMSFRSHTHL